MPSFNTVVLMGHLTRDPELRYTPQGVAVCDFGLAVNRKWTRKDGEKVDEVAFIDVTAWNRQAELAAEYLKKGRPVLIAGRLAQDRWEDPATGQKRSKLKVVAERLQFLGGAGTPGSKDEATSEGESSPEEPLAPEPLVVPDPDPAPAKPAAQKGRAPAARRQTA